MRISFSPSPYSVKSTNTKAYSFPCSSTDKMASLQINYDSVKKSCAMLVDKIFKLYHKRRNITIRLCCNTWAIVSQFIFHLTLNSKYILFSLNVLYKMHEWSLKSITEVEKLIVSLATRTLLDYFVNGRIPTSPIYQSKLPNCRRERERERRILKLHRYRLRSKQYLNWDTLTSRDCNLPSSINVNQIKLLAGLLRIENLLQDSATLNFK